MKRAVCTSCGVRLKPSNTSTWNAGAKKEDRRDAAGQSDQLAEILNPDPSNVKCVLEFISKVGSGFQCKEHIFLIDLRKCFPST